MATEKRLIDATPIIDGCKECSAIEWNKSVYTTWAEAEEDFMQRLLDAPAVDAVEVVFCDNCVNHGNCFPETAFRIANIEKPYCCVGKMDGDGNGT